MEPDPASPAPFIVAPVVLGIYTVIVVSIPLLICLRATWCIYFRRIDEKSYFRQLCEIYWGDGKDAPAAVECSLLNVHLSGSSSSRLSSDEKEAAKRLQGMVDSGDDPNDLVGASCGWFILGLVFPLFYMPVTLALWICGCCEDRKDAKTEVSKLFRQLKLIPDDKEEEDLSSIHKQLQEVDPATAQEFFLLTKMTSTIEHLSSHSVMSGFIMKWFILPGAFGHTAACTLFPSIGFWVARAFGECAGSCTTLSYLGGFYYLMPAISAVVLLTLFAFVIVSTSKVHPRMMRDAIRRWEIVCREYEQQRRRQQREVGGISSETTTVVSTTITTTPRDLNDAGGMEKEMEEEKAKGEKRDSSGIVDDGGESTGLKKEQALFEDDVKV